MSGFESYLTALPKYIHKKMAPSNTKKESRRSSILKPYKPPQLENSSCDKNSPPIERKVRKRRVSFAEKKHIKEFCPSNEQGTVWDSTYEEHDTSFKESSSITDSNIETELKENISECTNENDYKYTTFESGPHCSKNLNYTISNQSYESTTDFNRENDDPQNNMCDLNLINPIECTESSDEEVQLGQTALPCQNKSAISLCTSIISNPILEKSITMDINMDEECMQLSHLQHEQTAKLTPSNVIKYKDSDEKNCTSKASNKYSKSYNDNSEFNKTCAQNLSMEPTTAISKSLLPSCSYTETKEQKSVQKNDKISRSNLDTIADCNNASMKIIQDAPMLTKSALRTNCENTKCYTTNNYDNTTFLLNLQSNIVSKNIGTKQYCTDNTSNKKEDMNDLSCFNEKTRLSHRSMEFTKAIPVSSYKEKTFHIIDSTHSIQGENKIDKTELCKDLPRTNICDKEDPGINKELIFGDNKSKIVSSKNKEEITDIITCKKSKKNSHKKKSMNESSCSNEKTKLLYRSMEFTEVIPVSSYRERESHINDSTHSTQEVNKIDETELCKDLPRTNICDKEDPGINKELIFGDNKSKIVSSKNKEEITDIITCKKSKKNSHKKKSMNESSCSNEKTKLLYKSMEFTKAIPVSSCRERISHISDSTHSTQEENKIDGTELCKDLPRINICDKEDPDSSFRQEKSNIHSNIERIQGTTHEKSKNDAIKFCNNLSEMTNICNKETLRIDESTLKDNGPMISHDVSTEMTKQVTSKNQEEIVYPITSESICKNNSGKKEDIVDSVNLNESNKLLHKSMESTKAISILPCSERTLNTTAQSSSVSQAMLSKTQFPTKSSIDLICQNNTDTNKTIPNILMETLAANHLTTTSHLHESVNEIKNAFPNITTNATESRKNLTEKDLKIPKETIETADVDKKFSDDIASGLNNSNFSVNTIIKKGTGVKRKSEENYSISKKIHISTAESQSSQENNIHSLSLTNNDNMKNVEHDEHLAKNTINHTQASEPNHKDNLNDINECSFLRKSLPYLENDCVELQSIKPPSFVCLDSEGENSFLGVLEDLETVSTVNATINNKRNNNSDRLTTIIRESECLIESKKDVTQDHGNFKEISKEKEKSINIENNQTEHGLKNISRDNDRSEDQEVIDCPTTTKVTVINDSQNNKSNCCKIDVEEHNRESILSIINHEKSIPKTNEDQVTEKKCIKEKTNDVVKLKNNIENEERQLNEKGSLERKQCVDHLKERKTITEDPVDSEACQSSNDEIKEQRMDQEEKFADEKPETEQCINVNEDKSLQDTFLLLSQKLETHAKSDDCIWNIYQKNIDKKMIAFGFISKSLLIVTYFSNQNSFEELSITKIKVISRVADSSGVHVKIVHKVILEKVNTEILMQLYRSQDDVFPMLDLVSQEVKLAMDFMFDLKRLDDLNLMDITCDEISFVSRSKQMDVIIRVTIKVKRFDKLTTNDVSVQCLLGIIRETDVKSLIISIKKDHLFLRRYMNDVKSYVDIMEETPIK